MIKIRITLNYDTSFVLENVGWYHIFGFGSCRVKRIDKSNRFDMKLIYETYTGVKMVEIVKEYREYMNEAEFANEMNEIEKTDKKIIKVTPEEVQKIENAWFSGESCFGCGVCPKPGM